MRHYAGEATPAKATPRTLSHDDRALAFLREKLEHAPCPANVLDEAVEADRLHTQSAERAEQTLGVVARRISKGRGSIVHLCTAKQAQQLEAAEAS